MDTSRAVFARRLGEAMRKAGCDSRPAVLEREFNQRCWRKAVTQHGSVVVARKVARQVILALARANEVLPLSSS